MSNRLEWREISTQGINPNEGLRTYMDGLNNAHAATNSIRQNQRIDNQATIENHSRLLNDALKVDAHQESKKQQAIANDQKQQYLDSLGKDKAGKAPAYDKLAFENYTTKHFEQGGTLEDLAADDNFRNAFDTTDPKIMEHLLASSGRYKTRMDGEYSAYSKLINERYERNIASLPDDMTEAGRKAATEQYALVRDNELAGATDLYNSGKSIKSYELNQQLNGTAPSNRSSNGSVEQPALSRVKAVDTLRDAVISDTDQRKAELEKDLEEGVLSVEDYNIQMEMLESYRENNLKQIDNDANKANIKSFTGANVGIDYSISSSGSLVVGGKNVPERVGNALKQAAELTGQPLDIILPFVSAESSFNPNAVSKTNVQGLMQVTGDTADEVYARNKDVFARAGLTYDSKDRTNPETSALLGALYIGEIRNKLGNDAPMESVYMAYNLGPNDKLVDPTHDKDTPIDQLVPVSADKISVGLKNNKAVYQNKDGSWKTLNQAAVEIRRRAGVSDITLTNPAATIEERVIAERRESGTKVPSVSSEPRGDTLVNYTPRDFLENTHSTLSAASDIVNRYTQTSGPEGKDVKPAKDLTSGDIKSMLAVAGIEDISNDTAGKLYTKINRNPTLGDLNSDQIGMLLSYTPKGNFTKDIDDIGLDRNIAIIERVWNDNKIAVKANMDDAILAKKLMSDFQSKAVPLKDDIRKNEQAIAEARLKLDDDSLSENHIRAYNLDIDANTAELKKNQKALSFQTENIAERINPLLDNIARFTKTLEDTYAYEETRLAKVKTDELAAQVEVTPISLTDTTPEIAFNLYRAIKSGRYSNNQPDAKTPADASKAEVEKLKRDRNDAVESNQFTGNPFKDYATNKRLSEGKNK